MSSDRASLVRECSLRKMEDPMLQLLGKRVQVKIVHATSVLVYKGTFNLLEGTMMNLINIDPIHDIRVPDTWFNIQGATFESISLCAEG